VPPTPMREPVESGRAPDYQPWSGRDRECARGLDRVHRTPVRDFRRGSPRISRPPAHRERQGPRLWRATGRTLLYFPGRRRALNGPFLWHARLPAGLTDRQTEVRLDDPSPRLGLVRERLRRVDLLVVSALACSVSFSGKPFALRHGGCGELHRHLLLGSSLILRRL
jgi:hypothetical protein